jgi:mRNA interferase RelE/StbE
MNAPRNPWSVPSASVEKYSVHIVRSAAKELEDVDRKATRLRIVKAIRALAENPRGPGTELLAGNPRRLRIRIGDYRIVYQVDDGKAVVEVVKIGHRREVYRSRQ